MAARTEIDRILAEEGVFAGTQHPALARTAQRLVHEGSLRRLLPGVLCRWQDAPRPEVRIRAAAAWLPDAVVTGRAAARMTFWPELAVPVVELSSARHRVVPAGYRLTKQRLPPELATEVAGCRVTVPALTALDLAVDLGGGGIDRVLRLRLARLEDLAAALDLTPNRYGNVRRRALLLDSRDEPWSEAEREGHRLLRVAGITGWRGNLPVLCGRSRYHLDVGFEELRLGLEIDGYEVHRAENQLQFERDRRKWTVLANHGWTLLHFAAVHVFDEGDWFTESVDCAVRRARQQRAA